MKQIYRPTAAFAISIALFGCVAPHASVPMSIRQGTIEQITPTSIQGPANTGVGAIVGGVAGAGLGSMVGSGTGRDVAMVAGAVGGSMAGAQIANNVAQPVAGQQLFVRTDSGVLVEVTQPLTPSLRVGQRVFIQGNGEAARVMPQ